jgi:hypothetical protein
VAACGGDADRFVPLRSLSQAASASLGGGEIGGQEKRPEETVDSLVTRSSVFDEHTKADETRWDSAEVGVGGSKSCLESRGSRWDSSKRVGSGGLVGSGRWERRVAADSLATETRKFSRPQDPDPKLKRTFFKNNTGNGTVPRYRLANSLHKYTKSYCENNNFTQYTYKHELDCKTPREQMCNKNIKDFLTDN